MQIAIHKFKGKRDFTILPNKLLQRTDLSFKARGLMAYILSLPDDWKLYVNHLIKETEIDTPTAVRSALRELRKAGYMALETIRAKDTGRVIGRRYVAFTDIDDAIRYRSGKIPPKRQNTEDRCLPNVGETANIERKDLKTKEIHSYKEPTFFGRDILDSFKSKTSVNRYPTLSGEPDDDVPFE